MDVKVYSNDNKLLWAFGRKGAFTSGIACTKYLHDGTQQKIISALKAAILQAEGELSVSDNTDRMSHRSRTAAKVEHNIPIA